VTSTSRNMERTENPLVSLLRGVSNVLDRVSIYGIVVIMAAMTAIVFTQVFMRYVLNRSIPWGEEISRYMMIWVCFLGSAVAGGTVREHMCIDLPRIYNLLWI
jgi:TRAP-type C4-dicarboxylate transport system permease small subunit